MKDIDPNMADTRSAKDQLLGRMRVSSRMADPIQARRAALGIFRDNLADLACSETELLAAFGESYIQLWIREPLPVAMFADLLAVHLAHPGPIQRPHPRNYTEEERELRARAVMEITPALERALKQQPDLARPAGEIDPAGALVWLRQYRPHLVPSIFMAEQVPDGCPLDREALVKLMLERHPEIRRTDELYDLYRNEQSLPAHESINRKAFRALVPKVRRNRR